MADAKAADAKWFRDMMNTNHITPDSHNSDHACPWRNLRKAHSRIFSNRFSSLQNYFWRFTSLAALSGSAYLGLRQEQYSHASWLYCLQRSPSPCLPCLAATAAIVFFLVSQWLWTYCPGHGELRKMTGACRLACKAAITSGLCLRRSEVLRSLRHYLHAGTKPKTSHHRSPGGERCRESKHLMREGRHQSDEHWSRFKGNTSETSERLDGKHINGLSWAYRYHLELNSTELVCQYSAGTWSARHLREARSCTHATAASIQAAPREWTIGFSGKTFSWTQARCSNPCMIHCWACCMQKYCGQPIKYWGCYKKQQQRYHRSCISVPRKESNGTGKGGLSAEKQWLNTLYNCVLCRDTASATMSRH